MLERRFMIVGQHQRTICYVDYFAGPWQSKDEDLEDTSIARSLEIIRRCWEGLKKLNKDIYFRALFIEQDQKAYKKLPLRTDNSQNRLQGLCQPSLVLLNLQSRDRSNQIRNTPGYPVWQRNYYEYIIRNDEELDRIRQYIIGNPAKWSEDEDNPLNIIRGDVPTRHCRGMAYHAPTHHAPAANTP